MKLISKKPQLFTQASIWTATVIRVLLNVLLFVIIAALAVAVFKTGVDLIKGLHQPLEILMQHILVDIIFIAALVEISITILGYLKDGSVHVRYIVDTILIIMLDEIVSIWFDKPRPSFAEMGGVALIVAVLAAVRLSIMYSDHKYRAEPPRQYSE